METTNRSPTSPPNAGLADQASRELLKAVAGIRYGSVEVLIHDSRVVQIEAREKIRFIETPRKPG